MYNFTTTTLRHVFRKGNFDMSTNATEVYRPARQRIIRSGTEARLEIPLA